jgi:MFS family permease
LPNRNALGGAPPERPAPADPHPADPPAGGRHRAAERLTSQPTRTEATRGATLDERPARFADVLAVGEFRTIYLAGILSWIGDYAARAAVTALVLHATHSIVAAAAAFAITYAPWLLGGQVLVSLAERYPYRTVMITCDLARMALMALVAVPGLPLPIVLVLLLGSAAFSPPFDAARSATLPAVLPGDRYVIAVALNAATTQPVQVAGYLAGSALAAVNPRTALLINAATFAVSAVMIRFGVRHREAALTRERRTHLLHETLDGFRLVFGTPALRYPVVLALAGASVAIVPEGLGAPWAAEISPSSHSGLSQGLIMAGVPFGSILGSLVVTRLIRPDVRRRLLGALAVATPVPLACVVVNPPAAAVALLAALTGFAAGGLLPVANGAFVSVLPNEYRARAFGVVSGGLQLVQGFAVVFTGAIAARAIPIAGVVGVWCTAGLVLMLCLVRPWTHDVTGAARTPVPVAAPGTMES